jgi:RHS repeat-associated protein
MSQQRAGDAVTSPVSQFNIVNASDFNALKAQFGQGGIGLLADFDNNEVVNAVDFNLLKQNFGQAGAPPLRPTGPGPSVLTETGTGTSTSTDMGTGTKDKSIGTERAGKIVTGNNPTGNGATAANSYIQRTLYIGNLYEETLTDAPNPPHISYYLLGGRLVAMRRTNQFDTTTNGQYRIVVDHLSSVSLIVDSKASPSVVQRQYNKPYGEVAWQFVLSDSSLTSVAYAGQRADTDSGLIYYGARYYDPSLSFFISADPTTPSATKSMDFNRYMYVRGNPLRYVDTSGYGPEDNYIFVEGCIQGYVVGEKIGGCTSHYWGEYLDLLKDLYLNTWKMDPLKWEDWAFGNAATGVVRHVHHLVAHDVLTGAAAIESKIAEITGSGKINLVGHSEGGAAIMKYFTGMRAREQINGLLPSVIPRLPEIDPRVNSALLIDAPLNCGICHEGIGSWLAGKHVNVFDVETRKDFIPDHGPITGIDHDGNPDYSVDIYGNPRPVSGPGAQPADPTGGFWPWDQFEDAGRRLNWHVFTSTHVAKKSADFLRKVWGP